MGKNVGDDLTEEDIEQLKQEGQLTDMLESLAKALPAVKETLIDERDRYLAENRDFAGTAVFIFQPAEEALGGGQAMVEAGLFERFDMPQVFGLHMNELLGVVAARGRSHSIPAELLDQLLAREDLLIAIGPAEARQVVDHPVR